MLKESPIYGLAKDAARIILDKSWEKRRISDVMLYGSTLRGPAPSDVDLLVLHDMGYGMRWYSPYETLRVDEPAGEGNAKDDSYEILSMFGYREIEDDSVIKNICRMFAGEGEDSNQEIRETFDINVMNSILLKPEITYYKKMLVKLATYEQRRKAIESCRDPTFWHTILSEGRIYDMSRHDFTIPVEERYPGALSLFPSG